MELVIFIDLAIYQICNFCNIYLFKTI